MTINRQALTAHRSLDVAVLAITVGVVSFASLALVVVYRAIGATGPLGSINDIGNAVLAVLSALLAWRLWAWGTASAGMRSLASGLATVGAVIAVAGSALILTATTRYILAGFVSSVGFALVGVWLIMLNRRLATEPGLSGGLRRLGLIAGSVLAIGLLSVPAVVMRVDVGTPAAGWTWIGSLGWLGVYLLFPIWSIWFGRVIGARND